MKALNLRFQFLSATSITRGYLIKNNDWDPKRSFVCLFVFLKMQSVIRVWQMLKPVKPEGEKKKLTSGSQNEPTFTQSELTDLNVTVVL